MLSSKATAAAAASETGHKNLVRRRAVIFAFSESVDATEPSPLAGEHVFWFARLHVGFNSSLLLDLECPRWYTSSTVGPGRQSSMNPIQSNEPIRVPSGLHLCAYTSQCSRCVDCEHRCAFKYGDYSVCSLFTVVLNWSSDQPAICQLFALEDTAVVLLEAKTHSMLPGS